jgi:hypothetical protein
MRFFWNVYNSQRLNQWNRVATTLHFVAFVCMVVFGATGRDAVYQLTHTVSIVDASGHHGESTGDRGVFVRKFGGFDVYTKAMLVPIYLRLSAMLASFFFLSFAFQSLFASTFMRYIEYSITGSLMSVIILLQTQQTDVHAVLSVFFQHVTCMLLGALADSMYYSEINNRDVQTATIFEPKPVYLGMLEAQSGQGVQEAVPSKPPVEWWRKKMCAHALGWLPFATAWTTIFTSLATSAVMNPRMPKWVPGLVSAEFVLFGFFGITQMLHLRGVKEETIHKMYIFQSLFSKILLAAVLSSEIFFA